MADKVSELELKNIISQEINNSMGYMGGNLSAQRKKSLEYYMGEPLGTEIDGRSQVVSTDVADTIETILPNLLKIFTASDQTVKCEPVKAEDVELAEQALIILIIFLTKTMMVFQFYIHGLKMR